MNYKVIALSVGGLGNKVFRFGEEVTEEQFPKDRFAEILKGGFLEPIGGVKAAEKVEEKQPEEPGKEFKLDNLFEPSQKKAIEDITAKELREYLDGKAIEYPIRTSKSDLYAMYLAN